MKLSDKAYDILKFLCTRLLPAAGSLYFGLSKLWGFPYGEEVVGTISIICTFIGTIIGISSENYYKEEQELYEETLEEEESPVLATNTFVEGVEDFEVEYKLGDENLPEELTEEELILEADSLKDI